MPADGNSHTAVLSLDSVLCGASADGYLQLQFHFRFMSLLLLGCRGNFVKTLCCRLLYNTCLNEEYCLLSLFDLLECG